MTALITTIAILGAVMLVGYRWATWLDPRMPTLEARLVLGTLWGFVLLHLWLRGLDLVGVPWSLGAYIFPALAWWPGPRPRRDREAPAEPAARLGGWSPSDGVAIALIAVYTVFTQRLWNVHPDFVYHWGPKASRFFLADGIDHGYLAAPWNTHIHPDYPIFLPSLYALTGLVGRAFTAHAAVYWSVAFLSLSVLACRGALRDLQAPVWLVHGGLIVITSAATMFATGYLQAGGADWLITLAMVAGTGLLIAPPRAGQAWSIGAVAAFAAAAKIEGVPLAAFLLVGFTIRLSTTGLRPAVVLRAALRASSLPAVVIGLWLLRVARHGLFQASNTGPFDGQRLGLVLETLGSAWWTPNWHGMSAIVFLLPVLLIARTTRFAAALAALQGLTYLFIYLSTPVDPVALVLTTAPRLLFHLLPAIWLMIFVALAVVVEPRDYGWWACGR